MNAASDPVFSPYIDGANVVFIGNSPRIAVEYIGSGPLIMMLHGIGGDRATWAHQFLHLAEAGYCVAAWDCRGYGDSDDYYHPIDKIIMDLFRTETVMVCDIFNTQPCFFYQRACRFVEFINLSP